MLKLKSLLTEAPAGELGGAQDMVKKVTSKPLVASVSMLKKLAADPDTKDILLKGKQDGDIQDEQIKVSQGNVELTKLFPTQAEIGFGNSLDDIVFDKYEVIDKCFDSPVRLGPPPGSPLLCARIGGKIYVLDGHHRWSAAFMCNRNAKMECDILEMPSGETAESALRLMQVAILAKAGKVETKNFEGQDLMATGTDNVESYVTENIVDSAIEKFGTFTQGNLTDGPSIATEIGKAHGIIKSMKGKFPRNIMPQADHSGGDGTQDKVNQALAKGDINWKEPFVGEGRIKLKGLLKK